MIDFIYPLIITNVLSAAAAAYFWRKSKIQKARPETYELQEFLADLLSGNAMVHVKRIAPVDVVLRTKRTL